METNSTGGQGSRSAVVPNDDDDERVINCDVLPHWNACFLRAGFCFYLVCLFPF